jgi:hypothetical protein
LIKWYSKMEGLLKSQKVPTFEGKKEKLAQWSFTLSICQIADCKQVFASDPEETDVLDPVTNAEDLLARKANDTAYSLLTISVKDESCFQAVRNGITDELPSGSARKA